MGRIVFNFVLMLFLMSQMPATNAQRSIQQYLHLTGLPYSTAHIPATVTSSSPVTSSSQINSQPRPTSGLPSLTALSLPSLIVAASQSQAEPWQNTNPIEPKVDGKLLNNLAIALQMLILSNILNSSPTDTSTEKFKSMIAEIPQSQSPPQSTSSPSQITYSHPQTSYSPPQFSYSHPQTTYVPPQSTYSIQPSCTPSQTNNNPLQTQYQPHYSYSQAKNSYIPTQNSNSQTQNSNTPTQNNCSPTQNSYSPVPSQYYATQPEKVQPSTNLAGVSSFAEPKLEQTVKRVRSSYNLMSPYEAIAKPYSDSVTQYAPSMSRRDFQSPYAMIDTNMDFFPTNDLF